eukprot:TRINITY_DN21788_c0_g1_i1.p1 TRINITY_DN21788_c0_g1~~TRINITY_DN21788_c0_g1_i1.p1  ORF type:complete len:124 (+),score=10.31 TRINITY_DN21788_c0_g1_i1:57-428(+)
MQFHHVDHWVYCLLQEVLKQQSLLQAIHTLVRSRPFFPSYGEHVETIIVGESNKLGWDIQAHNPGNNVLTFTGMHYARPGFDIEQEVARIQQERKCDDSPPLDYVQFMCELMAEDEALAEQIE